VEGGKVREAHVRCYASLWAAADGRTATVLAHCSPQHRHAGARSHGPIGAGVQESCRSILKRQEPRGRATATIDSPAEQLLQIDGPFPPSKSIHSGQKCSFNF
jgi:hypothetical protein